jgi:hypothetical protein
VIVCVVGAICFWAIEKFVKDNLRVLHHYRLLYRFSSGSHLATVMFSLGDHIQQTMEPNC